MRRTKHRCNAMPMATGLDSQIEEMNPLVRLWILRILVPLGGMKYFVERFGYADEALASSLGFDTHADIENMADHQRTVAKVLQRQYHEAEQHAEDYGLPAMLESNIAQVQGLLGLSREETLLLAFAVMLKLDDRLDSATDLFRGSVVKKRYHKILAIVLDIPENSVRAALHSQAVLKRSGLLESTRFLTENISDKLEVFSDDFAEMLYCYEKAKPVELLRESILSSAPAKLARADYRHIKQSVDVMLPYLQHSLESRQKGVNILFHGEPGTGKTELARLMASLCDCKLYEVSSEDSEGDSISGGRRLSAYRAAQYFLGKSRSLLLFDEVEDVFDIEDLPLGRSRKACNKAWMNRMLEENTVPTFWITNNVDAMDPANIRRFDIVIEVPVPKKPQREKIIRREGKGLLDKDSVARMAESEELAPAVVERAGKVIGSIRHRLPKKQRSQAMEMLLNATLESQGHKTIPRKIRQVLPAVYNPAFINADADMAAIGDGLIQHQGGRLCLYGPPGTGKTAYGHWLAEKMQKPLVLKRGSDLLSMYVGGTEQNIAGAFRQAEEENAILMIDEVDGFLQDRRGARQSWEVTGVNELLTQMEQFEGIFIASTNLVDNLDQAALRRFDLKAKFDFLQHEQAWQLFCKHCEALGLDAESSNARMQLYELPNLTPGDFAAVIRQSRFNPLKSVDAFTRALATEVRLKEKPSGGAIGFIRH